MGIVPVTLDPNDPTIVGVVSGAYEAIISDGMAFSATWATDKAVTAMLAEAKKAGARRVDSIQVSLTIVHDRMLALATGTAYR